MARARDNACTARILTEASALSRGDRLGYAAGGARSDDADDEDSDDLDVEEMMVRLPAIGYRACSRGLAQEGLVKLAA